MYNVLGYAFKSIGIIALNRLTVKGAESAMLPAENLARQFLRKKLFFDQHLDDPNPEHLLQRLCADFRSYI